jgi:penicillin-binding protein 1A
VAIDVRTHHVVALVGNVEAAVGGLDRAMHAHRQPGSTFKPFVYGAALKAHKVTPATLIEATPGDFGGWNPKNYEAWTKEEPVRVRDAIAQSINLVAVRVTKDVGPQTVIDFARSVGITSPLKPDLAIALGSYEVAPLELATAYCTFAAGGIYEEPTIITRLVGPDGRDIALPGKKPPVRALEEAEAYLITSLLTSVVEKGTAMNARVLQRPLAGKTGTSNLAKDTWFAGYTPSTVAVAWIGFDDARPLGAGEFGARTALPAWISLMREATKGQPKVDFPRPQGVINVKIDPKTGKLPYAGQDDAIDEIFLTGTDPTEVAPIPEGKDGEKPVVPKADAPEDPWKSTTAP